MRELVDSHDDSFSKKDKNNKNFIIIHFYL